MKKQYTRLAAFFLLVLCASYACAETRNHSDCTPSFPFHDQWLGADVGHSVPLADGRDVWIFGDTLYGDKREVKGDDPRMVRNTLGISTCKDGKWNIDYVIRKDGKGGYLDFFQYPTKQGPWYWALGATELNNELWVGLLCVRSTPKADQAALGFEICGTDLAHVTGLSDDPQKWKVSITPLTEDALHLQAASTLLVQDDYLYLFSNYESKQVTILLRIPVKGLDDPKKNLEYLAEDGQWRPGVEPAKAKVVMKPGASEMTVNYHPDLKKWLAVLVDPNIYSAKVLLRTAPDLAGPWTDGDLIHQIAEMQKTNPHYDADTFCYAGKEHPEFEKPNELLFTYVCNTMKPQKLMKEDFIYYPQLVKMPMPQTATAGAAK